MTVIDGLNIDRPARTEKAKAAPRERQPINNSVWLPYVLPVVVVATRDAVYSKVLSNVEEVKARRGRVLAIVNDGDDEVARLADHVIEVPETDDMLTPVLSVVPLQLLAYHIAVLRGCDVDKPRNLAKSVTVE